MTQTAINYIGMGIVMIVIPLCIISIFVLCLYALGAFQHIPDPFKWRHMKEREKEKRGNRGDQV